VTKGFGFFTVDLGESMVRKITAIRKYRPEIKRARTLQMPDFASDMTRSTGLSYGEILHVVYQLRDSILMAHRRGQAVKIEALGTFTPSIRMDGSFDILFRPDPEMLRQLNDEIPCHDPEQSQHWQIRR
jgi:hypothetical protein